MTPTVRVPIGVHTQTSLISHHRATDFVQSPFAVTFSCGCPAHMRHALTSHGASAHLSTCPPISPSPHLRLTALEAALLTLTAEHRTQRRRGTALPDAGAGALGPVRARCLSGDSRVMVRVAWRGPWNCAVCVGATLLTCLVSKACAPRVRVGTGRDTTMVLTY